MLTDYTEEGFRGKQLSDYFETEAFKADGCKNLSLLIAKDLDETIDYKDESLAWNIRMDALIEQTLTNPYLEIESVHEIIDKMVWDTEEQEVINGGEGTGLALLKANIKSWRSYFVTGEMDPRNDADWKQYLDLMDGCGIKHMTELAQQCYDRMYK